jgi:hypothetical protein
VAVTLAAFRGRRGAHGSRLLAATREFLEDRESVSLVPPSTFERQVGRFLRVTHESSKDIPFLDFRNRFFWRRKIRFPECHFTCSREQCCVFLSATLYSLHEGAIFLCASIEFSAAKRHCFLFAIFEVSGGQGGSFISATFDSTGAQVVFGACKNRIFCRTASTCLECDKCLRKRGRRLSGDNLRILWMRGRVC